MAVIDYMKVIDILSDLFGASHEVKLTSTDNKLQSFKVETPLADGAPLIYKMVLMKYDLSIFIDKQYFKKMKTGLFMSKIEYLLEQKFMKNIKLKLIDDGSSYTLTISV
jgi:hypothetical protein